MSAPEISIIVPVGKNRMAELGQLKKSLADQSFRNFELLIEVGPSAGANRNLGASTARGKILLFLDSDITLSKHMLRLVHETLKPRQVLVFWKATAFAAIYKKDFLPFDQSYKYAEDTKWFAELEKDGIKLIELIQNRGNPTLNKQLEKSFWYPIEWNRIGTIDMLKVTGSLFVDILKRIITLFGVMASLFIKK